MDMSIAWGLFLTIAKQGALVFAKGEAPGVLIFNPVQAQMGERSQIRARLPGNEPLYQLIAGAKKGSFLAYQQALIFAVERLIGLKRGQAWPASQPDRLPTPLALSAS